MFGIPKQRAGKAKKKPFRVERKGTACVSRLWSFFKFGINFFSVGMGSFRRFEGVITFFHFLGEKWKIVTLSPGRDDKWWARVTCATDTNIHTVMARHVCRKYHDADHLPINLLHLQFLTFLTRVPVWSLFSKILALTLVFSSFLWTIHLIWPKLTEMYIIYNYIYNCK